MTGTTNHATHPALAVLQTRLRRMEKKAERRVTAILADTKGVYGAVREKWPGTQFGSQLNRIAAEGQTRLASVVKRAEIAGAEALDQPARLQGAAVGALGFATRDQIQDLTREVKRLAKKAGQPARET